MLSIITLLLYSSNQWCGQEFAIEVMVWVWEQSHQLPEARALGNFSKI